MKKFYDETIAPPSGEPEKKKDDDTIMNEKEREQILDFGSVTAARGKYLLHCLTVIGQVEGHYALSSSNKTTKYEHVIPHLVAVEESSDVQGLLIVLNTVGGDVEAGLAIAELIAGMQTPTVSLVLGGGHSIGVPLAVSAQKSFIVPSASMTIHPVRMSGLVLGVPQTLEYFQRMTDRITRFVTTNSGITPERFQELSMNTGELVMDVGTILDGEQAVAEGLVDSIGSLSDAVQCLYRLIEEKEKKEKKAPVKRPAAAKGKRGTGKTPAAKKSTAKKTEPANATARPEPKK